jgi:hypothetical protein
MWLQKVKNAMQENTQKVNGDKKLTKVYVYPGSRRSNAKDTVFLDERMNSKTE